MARLGHSFAAGAASALGHLAHGLVDAALPQTCAACGAWVAGSNGPVCPACHDEVCTASRLPYCPRCGRTLPRSAIHDDGCARCRAEPFWNVAGVVRVGRYTPALRSLLVGLKYHGHERNAGYLADRLAAELRERGWLGELNALVPVPMHWLRRAQRPCDHARLLAGALARRLKLPVIRAARRMKHTPSQVRLGIRAARFENVKGCFGPARRYWPAWLRPVVAGKTVCIIDNLISTGATVHEVSKVLRKAGARRIYAAVVARPATPGDPPIAGFPDDAPLP